MEIIAALSGCGLGMSVGTLFIDFKNRANNSQFVEGTPDRIKSDQRVIEAYLGKQVI